MWVLTASGQFAGVAPLAYVPRSIAVQTGLHEELRAVGLVTLGLEDGTKTISPHDFSLDLLDKDVKALVVGADW
jgi:hypothetical protein